MHRPGDASDKVPGPGSENNLLTGMEAHDLAEAFWATWNSLDNMPWLEEEEIDMPLVCLETLQWTPALDSWTDEDPGSEFTHLSERTRGLDSLNLDDIATLDDAAASQACSSRPCTVTHSSFATQWSVTDSPASQHEACPGPDSAAEQAPIAPVQACTAHGVAHHQQPAADQAPPAVPTARAAANGVPAQGDAVAPACSFQPPAWVEPGYMGGAQRAAAGWVAAAAVTDPKQQPLVRQRSAAEPAQPHAVTAPNLAPPVLPELATDVAPRQLAQHMPQLPAERAINKRARCSAQRKRAKLLTRDASANVLLEEKDALEGQVVALLDRHEQLGSDLPLAMQHEEASFTASMISCLAAAGPAMPPTPGAEPLMAPLENLRRAPSLEGAPEQCGNKGILWSTIVTFLKLSKPQKDSIAAAYIAHMQWVDALRSKCLSDTAPFQISGQLIGLAMQEQDIMQSLTHKCQQALDKVQLDNLHALAPAGTPAELALCRELAAPSRAPPVGAITAAVGTPPMQRRQAVRSRQAAFVPQVGAPGNTRAAGAGRAARRKRQTPNLP